MTVELSSDFTSALRYHITSGSLSQSTIDHYTKAVSRFVAWRGNADLSTATTEEIEHYLSDLAPSPKSAAGRRGDPLAPATRRWHFAGLQAVFKWHAARESYADPMFKMRAPKVGETQKDVVPRAEILRVVDSLAQQRQYRDAALIILLATVGIRAKNVVNLDWADVDWDAGMIRLDHTKNGDSGRTVPIIPIAGKHLSLWRDRRRDKKAPYVFGSLRGKPGRLTRSGLLQIVKKAFAAHSIPNIGPHDLRHSFATHYMDANPDGTDTLKEIGGWKSDTMVRRYSKQGRARRANEHFRTTSPWATIPRQ